MTEFNGITSEIGRKYSSLEYQEIPEAHRERVNDAIIDVVGNAFAGVGERQNRAVLELARSNKEDSAASLIGDIHGASAETAALVNATTVHIIVQDDAHRNSGTHPGAVVIPTALAVAESIGADGKKTLTAITAGYDVIGRIGSIQRAFNEQLPRRPTPVFGPFGAAVAAGILMDLNANQLGHAIGFAANLASGLSQVWVGGTDEYALHCGFAARNGIMAARIAKTGLSTAPCTIEGDYGFFQGFFGAVPKGIDNLTEDIGMRFELEHVYAKAEPACGLAITPIQATRNLIEAGVTAEDIKQIDITVSNRAAQIPGVLSDGPFRTPTHALMAIKFGVASTLVLGDYSRNACVNHHNDPEIQDLVNKINIRCKDNIGKYHCQIAAYLDNETTEVVEQSTPEEPSRDEIDEKFFTYANNVLPADSVSELHKNLSTLSDTENVRSSLSPLQEI